MDSPTRTLALIQMEIGPDSERNLNKALGRTKRALQDGAKIVCLPELFRSRYFPQQIGKPDPASAETIPGESTDAFALLAREYEAVIIVPVFEKGDDGKFRNAAVIIDADGSIHAPYYKIHIPEDPGFFEKCYFYPGDHYAVHTTRYGRIAVLICYDQWFPEAARSVALDGADIIFYPTAIGNLCENPPGEGDWQEAWELIQRSHAIANSVHVAAVNRVGREGNIRFFGGSFVCDAFGKILGHAGDGEETVMATIDISMNAAIRDSWGFFRNRRPDTYTSVCSRVP
ncbi:MAG: carbon-nitrogen hydrolase, partial [Methanoregula sp.]